MSNYYFCISFMTALQETRNAKQESLVSKIPPPKKLYDENRLTENVYLCSFRWYREFNILCVYDELKK